MRMILRDLNKCGAYVIDEFGNSIEPSKHLPKPDVHPYQNEIKLSEGELRQLSGEYVVGCVTNYEHRYTSAIIVNRGSALVDLSRKNYVEIVCAGYVQVYGFHNDYVVKVSGTGRVDIDMCDCVLLDGPAQFHIFNGYVYMPFKQLTVSPQEFLSQTQEKFWAKIENSKCASRGSSTSDWF